MIFHETAFRISNFFSLLTYSVLLVRVAVVWDVESDTSSKQISWNLRLTGVDLTI